MRLLLELQASTLQSCLKAAKIWHRRPIEATIVPARFRHDGALALLWLQARLRRGRYARAKAENDTMTPEDAERWKELERRARVHGWTIDSLEVHADRPGTSAAAKSAARKGEFALVELGGDERVLATGDLDSIEVFLKSSKP